MPRFVDPVQMKTGSTDVTFMTTEGDFLRKTLAPLSAITKNNGMTRLGATTTLQKLTLKAPEEGCEKTVVLSGIATSTSGYLVITTPATLNYTTNKVLRLDRDHQGFTLKGASSNRWLIASMTASTTGQVPQFKTS